MTTTDHQHQVVRQWLSQPSTYKEGGPVEVRETHISVVFLTPFYAWKLLKPVRFDFLDFSTLQARCAECQNEIRLNRRLAPDVYLCLFPVLQTPAGLRWGEALQKEALQRGNLETGGKISVRKLSGGEETGEQVVDWVIQMRRLSDADTLQYRIEQKTASLDDLNRVLDVLIPFFQSAPHDADVARDGDVKVVRRNLRENLLTLQSHTEELTPLKGKCSHTEDDVPGGAGKSKSNKKIRETKRGKGEEGDCGNEGGITERGPVRAEMDNAPTALPGEMLPVLRNLQFQFTAVSADVFRQRVEEGWIRDGHGDLRAEHIYLEEPPVVVDCIAFNDRFRHADVLDEICFLATDLINLGRHDFARELIARYRQRMADSAPDALAAFFQSYRFTVRAKVACLRSEEQNPLERGQSLAAARRMVQRAYEVLRPFHQPWVIVFCGVSGSGKSTVARLLAEEIGAIHLASDVVRKELFGIDPLDHSARPEMYTPAANQRTYDALFQRAGDFLHWGATVLLDATFRHPGERQRAAELARSSGASFLVVEFRVSRDVAEERIRRREASGEDVSDADVAVLRAQWERFVPPEEIDRQWRLVVPAEWSAAESCRQIVSRLSVVYPSANN